MKILFLTHYSALYGANLAMLDLIEDLKCRYDVETVILCPYRGNLTDRAKQLGCSVICSRYIPWRASDHILLRILVRKTLNRFLLKLIVYKLKDYSTDIIYSNSSVTELGVKLANIYRKPCIWHLREFGYEDYLLQYLEKQENIEATYNKADALVAVSEAVTKHYCKDFKTLKIRTIYDGIKPLNICHKKHDRMNFCCVGRISENKGQIDILLAAKELIEKYADKFMIYVVGEGDAAYIRKIKKIVEDSNIKNCVEFCGYVKDIEEFLGNMDVGIMTSKSEAFGRVTVEYMAAKMSIIATTAGANYELLGNDGIYYDYGQYKELAQKMEQFLVDDTLAYKNSECMHEIYRTRFLQEINSNQIYSLCKECLHSSIT